MGSEFIPDSVELLYYDFQKIDIIRAESYKQQSIQKMKKIKNVFNDQ